MPKVIFHGLDGTRQELDVAVGITLMEAAIDNNINGIIAECGGACACATCHAYVAEEWLDRLPAMEEMEDAMLDAANDRRPNSRLTCQIRVTDALDGVELKSANNQT